MFSTKARVITCALATTSLIALTGVIHASATPVRPAACPGSQPDSYKFKTVAKSTRPTNIVSAYVTGPGHITYNKTTTATVGATASASITAEEGIVFASLKEQYGFSVTKSKSWTDGFVYTLDVPKGEKRRMRLRQESRSFKVTKYRWDEGLCKNVSAYSNQAANAPQTTVSDSWVLEK